LIGFPAHWAPDDLVFYTGDQFPDRYQNGAFIAFHGPVAPRGPDPGYGVVFVPMDADGRLTGDWERFARDFQDIGARPAGLAVGADGALFIVDDAGGRIWKVRYTGN
jgi:glucose/arabinose dehydrogenase